MRALPLVLFLSLFAANTAQAETWRVLHWDKFSLIAVDDGHRRTTGQAHTALPVLALTLYPNTDKVEAALGEQEVDCDDQRVRTRTSQMYFGDSEVTGRNTEIEPWREPGGEERDRILVRAVCNADGLKDAPTVSTTTVHEAMRAHFAAATAPKTLDASWAAAWRTFSALNGPDAIPTIEIAVQSQHDFVVAAITDDGNLILLSLAIEKVGDQRYRFYEAQVGHHKSPDVAAMWAMREADCGQQELRMLAWAGFDDKLRKKFGHDTNSIGSPFEVARPYSSDAAILRAVCASRKAMAGQVAVTSNLQEAIAAYRWFFDGVDVPAKSIPHGESWTEAYLRACGERCVAGGDDEPNGPTAGSPTAGSRS